MGLALSSRSPMGFAPPHYLSPYLPVSHSGRKRRLVMISNSSLLSGPGRWNWIRGRATIPLTDLRSACRAIGNRRPMYWSGRVRLAAPWAARSTNSSAFFSTLVWFVPRFTVLSYLCASPESVPSPTSRRKESTYYRLLHVPSRLTSTITFGFSSALVPPL